MLDLHNHLIPLVDDGAADIGEARAALRVLREQGVDTIVATPHFDASLTLNAHRFTARMDQLDVGWNELKELATAEFPDVRVERGVELMLDVPAPDLRDERTRLASTPFVLVEFAGLSVPPHAVRALADLAATGVIPVVAHPERYLAGGWKEVEGWREIGCYLQVNAGSLLGRYGAAARRAAFAILERGWADYLASDYHARGVPASRPCREMLLESGAHEQVELLMTENPRRLLTGQPPLPTPALAARQPFWRRLRDFLR